MKLIRFSYLASIAFSFSLSVMGQPSMSPLNPKLNETLAERAVQRERWKPGVSTRSVLPPSVDNSLLKFFPPIINQKGGSCAQASGIGYLFTYEMNRFLDRNASESEENQFAYFFTWNLLNDGIDQGGFVNQGLNLAVKYGIMTEADYGYNSAYQFKWANGYDKYLHAMHYRGKRLFEFPCTSPEELEIIKQYLNDKNDGKRYGGLLTFSTLTTNWKVNDYYKGPSETGYHSILTQLGKDGAHAITIAGYDDTVEYADPQGNKHYGAFIVVNSWGTSMHDKGRFYLPYYFFLNRGANVSESQLSTSMTGIEPITHEPKLVYKVRINYTSRNDLYFEIGSSPQKENVRPVQKYTVPLFYQQGGDYAMQGSVPDPNTLEFAVDYTPHLQSEDALEPKYFFTIVRSEKGKKTGQGQLEYLSLIDYRKGTPKEYVCNNLDKQPLRLGENIYSISTIPVKTVSANPNRWQEKGTTSPNKTYLLRTANGHFAKFKIKDYNPSTGQLTIQSFYQKDGTRNLKNK